MQREATRRKRYRCDRFNLNRLAVANVHLMCRMRGERSRQGKRGELETTHIDHYDHDYLVHDIRPLNSRNTDCSGAFFSRLSLL